MPRTRSLAWAELKIGLVSIFAVVMASLLIFLVTGAGGFFWQRYSLKTIFSNIAGLKTGAPVRLAGVEIGSVGDLNFVGDRVEVVLEIGKEHQPRITDQSVASLGSVSLLGEASVDLTASSAGMPLPEWGYVRSGRARGTVGDVTQQASLGIDEATALLRDIRAGRGSVGKMFTDEALYTEMTRLVTAAEEVAANINRGRGSLGRLANNPAAARSLEASLDNLEQMTARIRAGKGSLGKLLQDDSMARSLSSMSTNFEAISGRISRGEGSAGKFINDDQLYTRFNSMADRLDRVMATLQSGEGTAGRLLQDKALYENINGTMMEIRSLVANINKDPRKYLNMKVSLF